MMNIITIFLFSIISVIPKAQFGVIADQTISGIPLQNPQGLAVNDVREEFLVADAANDRIVIFDSTGAVVFTFGLGEDRHNPFGIAVDSHDKIIVSAMDQPVLWVYDYNGRFLNMIELPADVAPGRLTFDSQNNLLVVNRAGKGILILDSTGVVIGQFESKNNPCKPSGIAIDKERIILISSEGSVMTVFGNDGKIISSQGEHGRRPEDFSRPSAIAIDTHGGYWVIDSFRHHIKRYDSNKKFIDIFGQRGTAPGEFYFPIDIKISSRGRMAVLEKGSGRLQIFRLDYE
jgi:DNA-binding beta-propeller fold protein YncE